jgi:hypothetical protein
MGISSFLRAEFFEGAGGENSFGIFPPLKDVYTPGAVMARLS